MVRHLSLVAVQANKALKLTPKSSSATTFAMFWQRARLFQRCLSALFGAAFRQTVGAPGAAWRFL